MEKFLKRTPRGKPDKDVIASSSSHTLRQSTIHSLKCVVVVEDIERLKCKLQLPGQSVGVLKESLKELGRKIPPRHLLVSTKIGHCVNKLRKHPDPSVSSEARRVYIKWKSYFKEKSERPQIEVKCDLKAESLRHKAKTFFSQALGVETSHSIVESVEREVFHQLNRRVGPAYQRSMRTMVIKLRASQEERDKLLKRQISVEDFVKQYKKS